MDERDKAKGREFLKSKFSKGITPENRRLYKSYWAAEPKARSMAKKVKKHGKE